MSTRLIAITPGDCHQVDRVPWIHALAGAGLRTLLIREPELDRVALDALLLNAWGSIPEVVVHDRNPHARVYKAPLHLTAGGVPGDHPVAWSQSCHSAEEVDRAFAEGASWVTLSPVFRPSSKPQDTREPLGIDGFMEIAAGRPVVALGGITAARAADLASRGAYGVAVMGHLFGAASPEAAATECGALIEACRNT